MKHFRSVYSHPSTIHRSLSEVSAGLLTWHETQNLVQTLFTGSGRSSALRMLKGDFLESLQAPFLATHESSLLSLTPQRIGRAGIDGLFVGFQNGDLDEFYVIESKFGTGGLNPHTHDGRQMSTGWIHSRMESTSKMYSEVAISIEHNGLLREPKGLPDQSIQVPTVDGNSIEILRIGDMYFTEADIEGAELIGRLHAVSESIHNSIKGDIPIKGVLFKGSVSEGDLIFSMYKIDSGGYQIGPAIWSDSYSELPPNLQLAVRESLEESLEEWGYQPRHIHSLVDAIVQDPNVLDLLRDQPQICTVNVALDSIIGGVGSAAISTIISTLFHLKSGGYSIDHKAGAFKTALAVGSSATVGAMMGYNTAALLELTSLGESISPMIDSIIPDVSFIDEVTGTFVGASSAGITYSVVSFLLGQGNSTALRRGLLRTSVKYSTSVAATNVTMAAVMAFAAASTGTPISTLSGIAAHNAAMAFLGGGSIATGGGGMALGAVVLNTVGFGVGVGFAIGVTLYFKYLDVKKQKRYIHGLIQIQERIYSS